LKRFRFPLTNLNGLSSFKTQQIIPLHVYEINHITIWYCPTLIIDVPIYIIGLYE